MHKKRGRGFQSRALWSLSVRTLYAVVGRKAESVPRYDGGDYQPDRRNRDYYIQRNGARSAGAGKYPAHKIEVEYAVEAPVERAYNAQNIGNKVDYYHIFFSLQISMRVCRGLYARTRKGKIY